MTGPMINVLRVGRRRSVQYVIDTCQTKNNMIWSQHLEETCPTSAELKQQMGCLCPVPSAPPTPRMKTKNHLHPLPPHETSLQPHNAHQMTEASNHHLNKATRVLNKGSEGIQNKPPLLSVFCAIMGIIACVVPRQLYRTISGVFVRDGKHPRCVVVFLSPSPGPPPAAPSLPGPSLSQASGPPSRRT